MANELRIYQDFLGGQLDAAIDDDDTTLSSPAFAAMDVIDATNHMLLTLDPDGIDGAPEVVMVTAHSSSATTCTVVRGQNGTTARAHADNTDWVAPVLSSDLSRVNICTSTTRPAAPYEGMTIFETDTNLPRVYNGSAWVSMSTAPQKTAANSAQMHWAVFSGTTDASGYLTVTHGAGFTPAGVMIQPVSPLTGTVFDMGRVDSITATQFRVRALQHDGTTVASASISGLYLCLA